MSRTAIHERPTLVRVMFLSSTAITQTTDSVSKYLLAGVSNA